MEVLSSLIYPMLCVFLPSLIYEIILLKKGRSISKVNLLWIFIFVFYLYLCVDIAGIGSVWQIGTHQTIIRMDEINVIPFSSDGVLTYLLNILMFIPLGFLLPLIWKSGRRISNVLRTSLWFSFLIEFCQLFNLRATDIDDLMMNTLGGVLGFFCWKIWNKIYPKDISMQDEISKKEGMLLILFVVLGRFFLYNGRLFW